MWQPEVPAETSGAPDAVAPGHHSVAINPITAFSHVEIVHPDPDAAARFMRDIFGAQTVGNELAAYLEQMCPPGTRVAHVLVGAVVFQFIKPAPGLDSWVEQLATRGPSVHNVSIMVKGLEGARNRMIEAGCHELLRFDGLRLQDAGVIGATGEQRGYNIDARKQAGVIFEMIEDIPGWDIATTP